MAEPLPPTLEEIAEAAHSIAPHIVTTPAHVWQGAEIEAAVAPGTELVLKLELFQRSGTFKARGALVSLLALDAEARARGVTAASAGNHAIAVAYAANALGIDAKVVMQSTANPSRVAAAKGHGATVLLGGDGAATFALAERIAKDEGRAFIHPFEGREVALGTGTLGLEFTRQTERLDAVIIPVGGGGLAAGMASAIRAIWPECAVYGVEPEGANSMSLSFAAGAPQRLSAVRTIADSLGPPMALPYSYAICRQMLEEVVTVSDERIAHAAGLLFRAMKLAVEPAAAASTAALLGPLRRRLAGKRVGLLICGTNTDAASHAELMKMAAAHSGNDGT